MPVVLIVEGYRFGFYASDAAEPPQVHVKKNGKQAKYWLEPIVMLERNSVSVARIERNRETDCEAPGLFAGTMAWLLQPLSPTWRFAPPGQQ